MWGHESPLSVYTAPINIYDLLPHSAKGLEFAYGLTVILQGALADGEIKE